MVPIDMRPVHFWMGITHPFYGPMNLAIYANAAWYAAWINLLTDAARPNLKDQQTAASQR